MTLNQTGLQVLVFIFIRDRHFKSNYEPIVTGNYLTVTPNGEKSTFVQLALSCNYSYTDICGMLKTGGNAGKNPK